MRSEMLNPRDYSILFCVALAHILCPSMSGAAKQYDNPEPIPLESGWEYRWGDSPFVGSTPEWVINASDEAWQPIEFPSDPPGREGRTNAWFRVRLPDAPERGHSLYIYSIDLIGEFYLDGEKIYQHGSFDPDASGRFEGWPWHLIHLPDDYPGKYLYVRVYSDYPDIGLWGEIRLGSEYEHLKAIIHRDLFPFTVGVALLAAAIICFCLSLFLRSRTCLLLTLLFLNLGLVPILESQLKQLVFFAPVAWQYLAAGNYFLLPVSLAAVAHFLFGRGVFRMHQVVWQAHLVFLIGALLLALSGRINLSSTYIYFDWLSLFTLLAVVLSMTVLARRRGSLDSRIFAVSCWAIYVVLLYNGLTAHGILPWATRSEYLGPLFLMTGFLVILVRRYLELRVNLHQRTKELKELNHSLEARVDERTQALTESNRTKDRFLAIIGHDLRGPIGTFAGLLEDYAREAEDIPAEHLPDLRDSACEVYQLLENLLYWANSQEGEVHARKTTCQLRELAEKAKAQLRATADHKGIQVKLEISTEDYVQADPDMIITVLRNLLSNAIKFSNPGSSVQITSKPVHDQIRITCSDHGTGMSESQIQQFFLRDDSASISEPGTHGEMGTGLGLLISRKFVRLHGSELKADSRPDTGTQLYFELPTIARGEK